MIVKKNRLDYSNGLYLFDDVPYTGISLEIDNGIVTSRRVVLEGKDVKAFTNKLIPNVTASTSLIDASYFDNQYEEPCTLNNEEFNGIAYSFEEGICFSEIEYEFGWSCSEIFYGEQGNFIEVSIIGDETLQQFNWNQSGTLEKVYVRKADEGLSLFIGLDKTSALERLIIDGDLSECYKLINEKLKSYSFANINELVKLKLAQNTTLSGNFITNDVFVALLPNLMSVTRLELADTKLTDKVLSNIEALPKIKMLTLENNKFSEKGMNELKLHLLHCDIHIKNEDTSLL